MAACPARIATSDVAENSIAVPEGNSPGPDSRLSFTSGELLMALPFLSKTVTIKCTSSVPSVLLMVVLSAINDNAAGVPSTGHSGGGTCKYSLRYQYHMRFGRRK